MTNINPLSYGVDGLRATLTGIHHFGLAKDIGILATVTAALVALGGYLFSKIQI